MDINFLTEKPSNEDKFKGESHQLVANSIVNIIENKPDINLIGLEGSLGAGKSTVIELIKNKLKGKLCEFMIFDVEQHHYSSTKRAFIELFSDWLLNIASKDSQKKIQKAKDKALGNLMSYEKYNKSSISWWVVAFIVSIVFAASSIKPILSHLELYFTEDDFQFFCFEFTVWITILLSPGIVLIALKLTRLLPMFKSNNEDINSGIPTVGDLFKRNSRDFITERIAVTREVGSIELREAMKVFVDALPENKTAIIIIDNLDRVSASKVREIWSDLEIFTSLAKKTLRIILPFSNEHVAKAISDNGNKEDGYEFIAKRIPVSFRVPPIVSAGWQETFNNFWLEASPESNETSIKACSYLLDLLLPDSFNGHVTPRLMKRFINDIHSLKMTTPCTVHDGVVAFYIMTLQYGDKKNNYKIENILQHPENSDLIRTAHKKLNLLASEDLSEWPVQLMSIHYQTTPEIAQSELLNQPLSRALKQHDSESFVERSHIFGFDKAVQQVLTNGLFSDSIKITNELFNTNQEFFEEWVVNYLAIINHELKTQLEVPENQIYDDDLIDAITNLIEAKVNIDIYPIEKLYEKNLSEVTDERIGNADKGAGDFDGMDSLYKYSKVIKRKPHFAVIPNAKDFVEVLWPSKDKWLFWDIENISLNVEKIKNILTLLYQTKSEPPVTALTENILNRLRIGDIDFSTGFNENAVLATSNYDRFVQNSEFSNLHDIVIDSRWYNTDLINQYINNINRVTEQDKKDELIAQAFVHILQRKTYTYLPTWNKLASVNPDYKSYIAIYLPLISNVSNILDGLKKDEIAVILNEYVKNLIISKNIHRLNIQVILTDSYTQLKTAVRDRQKLLDWTTGWLSHLSYDDINLEDFDNEFVHDALDLSDECEDYKKIFYNKVDTGELGSQGWKEIIFDEPINTIKVLQHMQVIKYKLTNYDDLVNAVDFLFTNHDDENINDTVNNPNIFDLLLSVIPLSEKKKLLKKLSNSLLIQSLPVSLKERMIQNLRDNLKLPPIKAVVDQEIVVNMISSISINESAAEWLDKQSYFFENWSEESLENIANSVYKDFKWFSKLYKNKHLTSYIKNLKKVDDKNKVEDE